MVRGQLYRVYRGNENDTKDFRIFVIVSRQVLVGSKFSTVICAPVYSRFEGLSTQIPVGIEEGLKKNCSVFCDELMSVEKNRLTDFIGSLPPSKMEILNNCLRIALSVE